MRRELLTRWGRDLDPDAVLPEYPRPQLVRDSYLNLNGTWEHAFTPADATTAPTTYDGPILVPFSPEAPLSGVGRQLQPDERLWYRRRFAVPDGFTPDGGRLLLHFGAVDQMCTVWVNGVRVGENVGGYLPFTCDLTDAVAGDPVDHELVVAVRDLSDGRQHASGKQRLRRGRLWYTAQSGIWQTVWLEAVPAVHVERLTLRPLLAQAMIEVTVHARHGTALVELAGRRVDVPANVPVRVPVDDVRPWSPEDPHLYDVRVTLGEDTVTSYVGMRSVAVGPDAQGVPRLLLNGRPYFHAGVLDQGYWPDGLLTAPSDEALVHDIATMKRLGFTMLRKHIKVEPLRWYAHCDRLGMLVWQDCVNGGAPYRRRLVANPGKSWLRYDDRLLRGPLGRGDAHGRRLFWTELRRTMNHLANVVSLVVWVPFNEGWGQFDAAAVATEVTRRDPDRLVDHASGWHDQGAGDVWSLHVYRRPFEVPRRRRRDRRALVLSEYGGHGLRLPDHVFDTSAFTAHGRTKDVAGLCRRFRRVHRRQLQPAIAQGLSGSVYTQLSDVEDELNGLLTYDREVCKLPEDFVRETVTRLRLP